jgi:hypothetical protein
VVTKRVIRIPQADLTTIRITCKSCGRTAEGTVEASPQLHSGGACKLCTEGLGIHPGLHGPKDDPFTSLHSAWRRFKELEKHFAVEFVIPADDDKEPNPATNR